MRMKEATYDDDDDQNDGDEEGGYPEQGTEHRSPLGSKELFCLGHKDLEAQNELFQKFKDTLNAVNPFEMHLFLLRRPLTFDNQ